MHRRATQTDEKALGGRYELCLGFPERQAQEVTSFYVEVIARKGVAPPPSIRTYGTGKVLPFGLVACGRAGLSRNGIIYLKRGARKRGFVRGPASQPFFRHAKDVTRSIDIF